MFSGYIQPNEFIVKKAKTSTAAILVGWLSVPAVFLVYFMMTMPARIGRIATSAVVNGVQNQIGLGTEEASKPSFSFALLPFEIPTVLKVLITIPVVLLVLAWLGYQLVQTFKLLRSTFWLTNERLLGKSGDVMVVSPLNEIKNVNIEASIWGRMFGYANLNILTKSGAVTVYAVAEPYEWKRILMQYVE